VKDNRISQVILQRVAVIVCLFFLAGVVTAGAASSKKEGPAPAKGSPKTAFASQSLPLLLDVGADKCVPCIMMAPILKELKKEYAGILNVEFVDAWKNPEEAQKYRVRGIPTQIFYDASGRELGRHMGFMSKEDILRGFEELGITLKKPSKK
jgi:thioredoxin 1